MKKLFFFLAISVVVLGMAACGGNDPSDQSNVTFNIEVSSITPERAIVEIKPSSDEAGYMVGFYTKEDLENATPRQVLEEELNSAIQALGKRDYEALRESIILQGLYGLDTNYDTGEQIIAICRINKQCNLIGEVIEQRFTIPTEDEFLKDFKWMTAENIDYDRHDYYLKTENEQETLNWKAAKDYYGKYLPTADQYSCLVKTCTWTQTETGYSVKSMDGVYTIFLPFGVYWTRTESSLDTNEARCLSLEPGMKSVSARSKSESCRVRLIFEKVEPVR